MEEGRGRSQVPQQSPSAPGSQEPSPSCTSAPNPPPSPPLRLQRLAKFLAPGLRPSRTRTRPPARPSPNLLSGRVPGGRQGRRASTRSSGTPWRLPRAPWRGTRADWRWLRARPAGGVGPPASSRPTHPSARRHRAPPPRPVASLGHALCLRLGSRHFSGPQAPSRSSRGPSAPSPATHPVPAGLAAPLRPFSGRF